MNPEIQFQQSLRTPGEVAALLGKPLSRITYIIAARRINHAERVGVIRRFAAPAVEEIRSAIDAIDTKRKQPVARRRRGGDR